MEVWWQQDIQLYQQIFFAKHSIKKIRENKQKESFVGIFCYIQMLLSCIGNISKLLQHSEKYCEHLNVDLKQISNISNRCIRNMNEHIDERLNNPLSVSLHYSDMALTHNNSQINNSSVPQRTFNVDREQLQFADKRNGIMTVKITDLEHELNYLYNLEPIAYVVERYDGYDEIF